MLLLEKNNKKYKIETFYLLVDEQRGLTISGVAHIEPTSRLYQLVIKVVSHLWLGITIHKPKQVAVLILDPVLRIVFLTKEPWRLCHAIVRRSVNVEVLREVRRCFRPEIDARR